MTPYILCLSGLSYGARTRRLCHNGWRVFPTKSKNTEKMKREEVRAQYQAFMILLIIFALCIGILISKIYGLIGSYNELVTYINNSCYCGLIP